MARTKRKRSVVEIYTYSTLDEMFASPTNPTPEEFRVHQVTRMYQGLHAIKSDPNPSTDDWRVCSDAVNLMETLVAQGIAEDGQGLLQDAVNALAMAGKRHQTHGVIRLDAPGIQAVRAVLEDYSACLDNLPHRTMIRCHRATERRIRDIMRGKGAAHDVEVMAL